MTARLFLALTLSGFLGLTGGPALGQQDDPPPRDDPEVQHVEPFQVFDNLYYVGAEWVAAWVLETDNGLIVFDSLYGELTDFIVDGIRELGMDPQDIRYVVVSHAHFDHIGGARRLQKDYGAVIMMTQEDWDMAAGEPEYRPYPEPAPGLVVTDGDTLSHAGERLTFYQTPGHTPGVLSTQFTVYDDGTPHTAFMFGGTGLNFSGVERTETYIESVERLQALSDVDVNIPNHAGSGQVFERHEQLRQRQPGEPHPFVDPEAFQAWLDELLVNAREKLEEERAAE